MMFHGSGCNKQNSFVTSCWAILLIFSFFLLLKAIRLAYSKVKHTKQYFNASITSSSFCAFAIGGCLSLSITNLLRSTNVGNQWLLSNYVGPISLSIFGVFSVAGSLNVCMLWIELSSNTIRGLASKSNVQKSKKALIICSLFYFVISVALNLVTGSYNDTALLSVLAMVLISASFLKGSSMLAAKLEANMQLVTLVPQTQIQTQVDLAQKSRVSWASQNLAQKSRISMASQKLSRKRTKSQERKESLHPPNLETQESLVKIGPVPVDAENMQLVHATVASQIQTQVDLCQMSSRRISKCLQQQRSSDPRRINIQGEETKQCTEPRRINLQGEETKQSLPPANAEKRESLIRVDPSQANSEKHESLENHVPGDRLPRRERDAKVKKIIYCARAVSVNGLMFCFESVIYTLCSTHAQLGAVAFVFSILVTVNGLLVSISIMKYLEGTPWKVSFSPILTNAIAVTKRKYEGQHIAAN